MSRVSAQGRSLASLGITSLVLGLVCLLGTSAYAIDRNAFTFTRYDLQARVVPASQEFEVRGKVTLRNDLALPQHSVALQVSSTLNWQSIQMSGKPLAFVADRYTTDIDHTGGVSEVVVSLPNEVAPKATIDLEIVYAGTIPDTRLKENGKPIGMTAHSDWDQIGSAFTAVRGIGYVCWYPVALEAVSLADGAHFYEVLGEWRTRHAASNMRLSLALLSDKAVVTNGRLVGQKASLEAEGTLQQREYEFAPMGLTPPTFAIGDYTLLARPAVNVFYLPGHQAAAQEYALAEEKIGPSLVDWFGAQREKIAIVELPERDAPFDSNSMLFTPLVGTNRNSVELAVAHQLVHASISSPRQWIAEGLAHFAQALVRERQDGRKAALAYMQAFRPALATAEKLTAESSNSATGPSLLETSDEIYYRVKAMFVWWMLRDMLGDQPVQRAILAYRTADDKEPSYMQRLLEAQSKRQLEPFFDDWVYRDRGLPDFRIETAYPRQLLEDRYTVTITVENLGGVAAEVPVVVPLKAGEATQRAILAAKGKAVVRVQTPEAPTEVTVNDGSVPESDVSNNTFKLTAK